MLRKPLLSGRKYIESVLWNIKDFQGVSVREHVLIGNIHRPGYSKRSFILSYSFLFQPSYSDV